jgi:soluble lytic murein transglycosylase-like protein
MSNRWQIVTIALAMGASAFSANSAPTEAAEIDDLLADVQSLTTTMKRLGGDVMPPISQNRSTGAATLPYGNVIHDAAKRYWVPVPLIAAVIQCESNWQKDSVSPVGARGLMQVLPRTAMGEFGIAPSDLFDPTININTGTAYLRRLANRYGGDTATTVAAYNAGPGRVESGKPIPLETRRFKSCVRYWFGIYNRNEK